MSFHNFILSIVLFFITYHSNGQIHSGVINHKYQVNDTTSTGIDFTGIMENKAWFLDSLIVFEMKAIYDSSNFTDTGLVRIQEYELFKYVFLDLKTMKCQDYYSFSDSAQPQCNYLLPKNSTFFWSYFSKENPDSIRDKYKNLSDTVIDRRVLKRVKRIWYEYDPVLEYVYFLDRSKPQTILHFSRDLDELFPEYFVSRVEANPMGKVSSKTIYEMQILSEGLSEYEMKVIRSWEQNARNIKLPLISFHDSFVNCGSNKRIRK